MPKLFRQISQLARTCCPREIILKKRGEKRGRKRGEKGLFSIGDEVKLQNLQTKKRNIPGRSHGVVKLQTEIILSCDI